MRKVISGLLLTVILLSSCSGRKTLNPVAYMEYMEDAEHGLMKKVTVGAYEYRIQFAPAEYLASRQYYKEIEQGIMDGYRKRINEMKGRWCAPWARV